MPKESTIVASILRKLRRAGAFVEKQHGNEYTRIGMPDLVGCYLGRFIAIEVKRPGEEPRPEQYRVLQEIRAAGGVGVWMDDAAQVDVLLEYLNAAPPPSGRRLRPSGRPRTLAEMPEPFPKVGEGAWRGED